MHLLIVIIILLGFSQMWGRMVQEILRFKAKINKRDKRWVFALRERNYENCFWNDATSLHSQ